MTTPRMPDPPATDRDAPASPLDAATVLENAAATVLENAAATVLENAADDVTATLRDCDTNGCEREAEFYWHDAGPFGSGTFYGCADHAPDDAIARAEQSGHLDTGHTFGPGLPVPS